MPSFSAQANAWQQQAIHIVSQLRPAPVRPSNQVPLTDAEFAVCQAHIAEFQRILADRAGRVTPDRAWLLMPDSSWSWHNRNYGYMEAILLGDRRRLNFLRFYTRFTGFSLYYMDYHRGRETPVDLPADLDAALADRLAVPDAWVHRFVVMMRAHPPEIVVPPPPRFGEIGWSVRGITVNHDTCVYQERIGLLFQSGILAWLSRRVSKGRRPVIVEIGSGFGALAFRLLKLFPEVDYLCVDIPESLLFANLYLGLALPERPHRVVAASEVVTHDTLHGVTYLPNYLAFDALRDVRADLTINTLSFSELTEAQVDAYAALASAMIGDDGLLFEQNQDNRSVGMIECKTTLAKRFPHRLDLAVADPIGVTEGDATLWGNRPVTEILRT